MRDIPVGWVGWHSSGAGATGPVGRGEADGLEGCYLCGTFRQGLLGAVRVVVGVVGGSVRV